MNHSLLTRFPQSVHFALWILVFLPFFYLLYVFVQYPMNVPYADDWAIVDVLHSVSRGRLKFEIFVRQHMNDRPALPNLIHIALFMLNRWHSSVFAVNLFLCMSLFFLFVHSIHRTTRLPLLRIHGWLVPVLSLNFFSMTHSINIFWASHVCVYLNLTLVTGGLLVLWPKSLNFRRFFCSVVLGILATFSISNGLLYWVVGLCMLFISHRDDLHFKRWVYLWLLFTGITFGCFLFNYNLLLGPTGFWYFLEHPVSYLQFVIAYLGLPISVVPFQSASLIGILGIVIFIVTTLILLKKRWATLADLSFFHACGLYSVGSGFLTGIGRLHYGVEQATAFQYNAMATLFWASNFILLFLVMRRASALNGKSWLACKIVAYAVIVILVFHMYGSFKVGSHSFMLQHHELEGTRQDYMEFIETEDEAIIMPHRPHGICPKRFKRIIKWLHKTRLSIFRE